MLLELHNANNSNLEKLLAFAKANNIELESVVKPSGNISLPGKALNHTQLKELINKSRTSGTINSNSVHSIVKSVYGV